MSRQCRIIRDKQIHARKREEMSKLSKCSRAAKFQLLTSKDGTGMNLFSKDAQWPTFGTNPGILLADRVPKIRYRLKEHDWLDHTEKDGGQDGTVTR